VAVDGFLELFKGGEVYLDTANAVKTVLGSGKIRSDNLGIFLKPSTYSSLSRATKKYPEMKEDPVNSMDGFKLGGVVVISPGDNGEIMHLDLEESIGHLADTESINAIISSGKSTTSSSSSGAAAEK